MRQIGTVEILQTRTYALDMESLQPQTEVVVDPGVFPLYREHDTTFWVMSGVINTGGFRRAGDGLFVMTPGDVASEIPATFPSKAYGPDEWKELVEHPVAQEGHWEQRLRIFYSEEI